MREWPLDGSYDLFYMPPDRRCATSAGYAFVNFCSEALAIEFKAQVAATQIGQGAPASEHHPGGHPGVGGQLAPAEEEARLADCASWLAADYPRAATAAPVSSYWWRQWVHISGSRGAQVVGTPKWRIARSRLRNDMIGPHAFFLSPSPLSLLEQHVCLFSGASRRRHVCASVRRIVPHFRFPLFAAS